MGNGTTVIIWQSYSEHSNNPVPITLFYPLKLLKNYQIHLLLSIIGQSISKTLSYRVSQEIYVVVSFTEVSVKFCWVLVYLVKRKSTIFITKLAKSTYETEIRTQTIARA